MFQEVRGAIQAGERARARDLLTRILRRDPNSAEAWIWMSAAVESPRERIYCLKEALRIDPDNAAAKRGLAILGAMPADPQRVVQPQMEQRKWQTKLETPSRKPLKLSFDKRSWLFAGAGVIAFGLILFGIFGTRLSRSKQTSPLRTIDFRPIASATSATGSPPPPTATNTPSGPTPPWNLLAAPYTPTPAYVRTPHGMIEAYSIAIRAIDRQEPDKALEYMIQAATSEPGTADLPYQIGELYRARGDFSRAVSAYQQAIANNPAFAPAYLGRVQAGLSSGLMDAAAARGDLETAVMLDPLLVEARFELARLELQAGLYPQAMDQLNNAEMLQPESPLVYLIRGQVYLAQGDAENALAQAARANQLDLTLLPVYLLTGEALQASGSQVESIVPLEIYLRYIQYPDARAQILLARGYAAAGDMEKALAAVSAALEIVPKDADVLLLRGDFYLEYNQPELALADYREALRLEPNSFAAGIAVGRAQLALGDFTNGYLQINKMERFALSNPQKGEIYYWRAQLLEKLGEYASAFKDWGRLLDLPAGSAPEEWLQTARQRIEALITATPAPSRTPTPKSAAP